MTIKLPPPDTHCEDLDTGLQVWSYSKGLVEQIIADKSREIAALKEQEAQLCTLYGLAHTECKRLRKDADRWRAVENATVDLTARLHMADKSKRTEVIDAAIAAKGGSDD